MGMRLETVAVRSSGSQMNQLLWALVFLQLLEISLLHVIEYGIQK